MWRIPFFDRIRIPNIIRFSEITEYRISNTIRYWENPNTEYRILFGIKKIRIPNTNSTIRIVLFGRTIRIPNSIENFGKNETKIKIFVPYKTFCSENMWNYSDRYSVQLFEYPNTIRGAKKPEYRILFGIEKIRIPNTNTTIRSNYSNSIRIPNYSSHPGCAMPLMV